MNSLEHDTEILVHKMLLEMDVDQLFHHMKDPRLFNKIKEAERQVITVIKSGEETWGSIYE